MKKFEKIESLVILSKNMILFDIFNFYLAGLSYDI